MKRGHPQKQPLAMKRGRPQNHGLAMKRGRPRKHPAANKRSCAGKQPLPVERRRAQKDSHLVALRGYPLKRPASGKLRTVRKCGTPKQLAALWKVAMRAENYSKSVLIMLGQRLELSLAVAREDRTDIQERIVQMQGEVMDSIEISLQRRMEDAETRLAEADAEQLRRETASWTAEALVQSCVEAAAKAKQVVAGAAAMKQYAESALAQAQAEQEAGDRSFQAAAEVRMRLEGALRALVALLGEDEEEEKAAAVASEEPTTPKKPKRCAAAAVTPPCKDKASRAVIGKAAQELKLEKGLLQVLPQCLKQPAQRGSFRFLVLEELAGELERSVELYSKTLSEEWHSHEERLARVANARLQCSQQASTEEASLTTLLDSRIALRAARDEQKAKKKVLNGFGREMKQVDRDLTAGKKRLERLRAGPLATFRALAGR